MSQVSSGQKKEKDSLTKRTSARRGRQIHLAATTIQYNIPGLAAKQQNGSLLQRQCVCGTHTIGGGECDTCRKKREASTFQHSAVSPISKPVEVSPPAVVQSFPNSNARFDLSQVPVQNTDSSAWVRSKLRFNQPHAREEAAPQQPFIPDTPVRFSPINQGHPHQFTIVRKVSNYIQPNRGQRDGRNDSPVGLSGVGNTITADATDQGIIVDITHQAEGRYVLLPRNSNGKTLYFFYGYNPRNSQDRLYRDEEAPHIADDVVVAAARGFAVVYDEVGTGADFVGAIYDPNCFGIYWSGHGTNDGRFVTADNLGGSPHSIDPDRVSPNLRYLILAGCNTGIMARVWRSVLPSQCLFEGWEQLTSVSEGIDFTSTALVGDSLISHGGMNPNMELPDYINYAARED